MKRTLSDISQTAKMLETYAAEVFPEINACGQKHFGRVMMEASAEEIRSSLADIAALLSEARRALAYSVTHMEYDFPADVPEECGMFCCLCRQHVNDDLVHGHDESCLISRLGKALRECGRDDTVHAPRKLSMMERYSRIASWQDEKRTKDK